MVHLVTRKVRSPIISKKYLEEELKFIIGETRRTLEESELDEAWRNAKKSFSSLR